MSFRFDLNKAILIAFAKIMIFIIAFLMLLSLVACEAQNISTEEENATLINEWRTQDDKRYVVYIFGNDNFIKVNGIIGVGQSHQTWIYSADEFTINYNNKTEPYQIIVDTLYFEGYKLIKI